MIQINELRVGNYLKRLDDSFFKVAVSDFAIIESLPQKLRPLPIPLTPEILEKCGFVVLKGKESFHGYSGNSELNYGCPVLKLSEYAELRCNALTHTGNFFLNGYRIKCQHLHQLQNLFQSLTGEELNIQL